MPKLYANGLGVDLDRGVQMSSHSILGIDVYMYLDDPGIYYDAHGNILPMEVAEQSGGFDTVTLERKRKIKAALHDANEDVLKKFGEADGPVLVEERDGFTILDYGMDRYKVFGPDDKVNALHKLFLPLAQAKVLLDHLAPVKVVEEKKEVKPSVPPAKGQSYEKFEKGGHMELENKVPLPVKQAEADQTAPKKDWVVQK